jgi:hypothetical protein
MFEPKSPVYLAKRMVGVAMSAVLLGALLIGMTSWKAPGWVMVTYGALILFIAYHVNAAPCLDEPDSDTMPRAPYRTNASCRERLEELTAEALANYHA